MLWPMWLQEILLLLHSKIHAHIHSCTHTFMHTYIHVWTINLPKTLGVMQTHAYLQTWTDYVHCTIISKLLSFSCSLNVMVGYLCVWSLLEWTWMFVSILERQRAILVDGHHHTVVWQRCCRKLTFWPRSFLCWRKCVTRLHSRNSNRQ